MPTALITGASGFLGRQVLTAFADTGYNVVGTGFSRAKDPILKVDITSAEAVEKLFEQVK
jgi:S-adenosylmethionine synthetase